MKQHVRIDPDACSLGGILRESESARAVVVINPAMGVPLSLYDDFADWLCAEGHHVIAWNYRGTGLSGNPVDNDVHLHQWGEEDLEQVLAWCEQRWPDMPRVILAHSVGGQLIGMSERSRDLAAIVTIASQSGYWKHYSGWQRWRIAFFWFLFIPIICRITRAFPGRSLGLAAEDLPARVTREWARWGRDPEYHHGRHRRASIDGFARIECPLLSVWIADDDLATRPANRAMVSWYPAASVTQVDLHPQAEGLERIGHFGFFRAERGKQRLWPKISRWLAEAIR